MARTMCRASRKLSALTLALAVASAVALIGCGSDNPAGPSGGLGVNLRGMVLDQGVASAFGVSKMAGGAQAAGDAMTVTVQENQAITASVGEDGSFTLRGLPEGNFTLIFKSAGGVVLGTLTFTQVKSNQEITVTVQVTGGGVLLIEERRNGIGHGDLEIEGLVDQVVTLSPTGDSTFVIDGYTVVARPGQTAIREGNRSRSVQEVTAGRRVHVKGVWLAPSGSSGSAQQVLAHEIKLQGPEEDGDDDGQKITICHKKKNTLSVSVSAWPAHQAHGDTMGACK
jgi:hypothetical protein